MRITSPKLITLVLTAILVFTQSSRVFAADSLASLMSKYNCSSISQNAQFNTAPSSASSSLLSDHVAQVTWGADASTSMPNGSIAFYVVEVFEGGVFKLDQLTTTQEGSGAGSVSIDLPTIAGKEYVFQVRAVASHPGNTMADGSSFNCSSSPITSAGSLSISQSSTQAPSNKAPEADAYNSKHDETSSIMAAQEDYIRKLELLAMIEDQSVFMINLSRDDVLELGEFRNLSIKHLDYGSISFAESLNLDSTEILEKLANPSSFLSFYPGIIEINTEVMPILADKAASVVMKGLDYDQEPKVLVDGIPTTKTTYLADSGTVTVDVSSFSKIEVEEAVSSTPEEVAMAVSNSILILIVVIVMVIGAIIFYLKKSS